MDEPPVEEAVEEEEERDPLDVALERAEFAEKEIAYKEAEIQNVRKRLMARKPKPSSLAAWAWPSNADGAGRR